MNATYWRSEIEQIEKQVCLLEPNNLQRRVQALKTLSQCIKFVGPPQSVRHDYRSILEKACVLQHQLFDVNSSLFDRLRTQIRDQGLRGSKLRNILADFTSYSPCERRFLHFGNSLAGDGLNALINGVFQADSVPIPTLTADPEMVHLEMTPMSVVLELQDRITFRINDMFVDIGAGQGQLCLLLHLLTGVQTTGIEVEPAYVHCATEVARTMLNDKGTVKFVQEDARHARYSFGTIFFLFTPFTGRMFRSVMEQLRECVFSTLEHKCDAPESGMQRPLICTYGDITLEVSRLPWLQPLSVDDLHPFRLAIFEANRG